MFRISMVYLFYQNIFKVLNHERILEKGRMKGYVLIKR